MKDRIEVGDIIDISISMDENIYFSRCKVLHTPCATGDSWHVKCIGTGEVFYVNTFAFMKLIRKGLDHEDK